MDTRSFQLFLVGRMRAPAALLHGALRSLGADRRDVQRATAEAAAFGLAEAVHGAGLYQKALGAPVRSAPDASVEAGNPFAGSTAHHFALPLWPELEFVVREDTRGCAWGFEFRRSPASPTPVIRSARDLRPWAITRGDVAASLGAGEEADAWDDLLDLSYQLPAGPAGDGVAHLLRFDFALLQAVERVRGPAG